MPTTIKYRLSSTSLTLTKNDLFVERIVRDVDLWDNIIPRVESFFRLCVLPEVLGQQLTRGKFQLQDDQEGEKA
ncbi:hypothetical protein JOQ06_016091 [Pogonophryne albipinna]|uniref:Uncharacterized protein n=1 Tax=Pogonophryne albipinna TaxID=1090488 RepID=A0AAD6AP37_9TELE|nr:hypothetical protein JOQ06_016091 [Pogonophryne albipinna]